jgi:hypothetical protein
MVPQAGDSYLKMRGEYYVAWPLEVPSLYGEWSLVSVLCPQKPRLGPLCDWQPRTVVVPVGTLSNEEVRLIKNCPLLLWGMKVTGQSWALVMCRPSKMMVPTSHTISQPYDPQRAIGV